MAALAACLSACVGAGAPLARDVPPAFLPFIHPLVRDCVELYQRHEAISQRETFASLELNEASVADARGIFGIAAPISFVFDPWAAERVSVLKGRRLALEEQLLRSPACAGVN